MERKKGLYVDAAGKEEPVYVDREGREYSREEWEEGLIDEEEGVEEGEYVPATTWHGVKSLKASEWDALAGYKGYVVPPRAAV